MNAVHLAANVEVNSNLTLVWFGQQIRHLANQVYSIFAVCRVLSAVVCYVDWYLVIALCWGTYGKQPGAGGRGGRGGGGGSGACALLRDVSLKRVDYYYYYYWAGMYGWLSLSLIIIII